MMWQMNEMWSFGMGVMWIFPIAFFGLLLWGAISLYRIASKRGGPPGIGREDNAMAILKERYAKEELSTEDFQRMRAELE